jgi:hypothetical protein
MMLDKYLLFNDWKKVDEDAFYDWKLLRKVKKVPYIKRSSSSDTCQVNRSLKILREKKDVRGVLGVLETCIRTNFVGVESPRWVFFQVAQSHNPSKILLGFTVK